MRIARRALLFSLWLVACDTPPPAANDAGVDSAVQTDAFASDVGLDTGPPAGPRFCGVCHRDEDCAPGALCLLFDDGVRACGAGCGGDGDCAELPVDARCEDVGDGLPMQCRPTSGVCTVSAPGSDCSTDPCSGTFDRCVDFDERSVCTTACVADIDCPIGMRRCLPHLGGLYCAPDPVTGPEGCSALVAAGDLSACTASCTSGECYGAGDADSLAVCLPDADAPCEPLTAPDGSSVCTPPACACALEDPASIFGAALTAIGRTACDLHFPSEGLDAFGTAVSRDRFRLSFTDRIRGYAPEIPRMGDEVAAALDAASDGANPVSDALIEAASLADLDPVDARLSSAPDLAIALAALVEAAGDTPDLPAIEAGISTLSPSAQNTLSSIVLATESALRARNRALEGIDIPTRDEAFRAPSALVFPGLGMTGGPTAPRIQGLFLGDVDMRAIAQAAIDLAATVENYDLVSLVGENADLTITTHAGTIALRGSGDDTYEGTDFEAVLLVIDLGGDDTYRAPVGATASSANGLSLLLDLGGTDDYAYREVPVASDVGPAGHRRLPSDGRGRAPSGAMSGPSSFSTSSRQGAGRLGIGMLFDLGIANDHYRSLRMSQGYGALGVGVLYDQAGDDVYEGEAGVQGAASVGLGLLLDGGGDDHFTAYAFSQGFGYVRGIGVLHDDDGTDDYFSHPTDVLYWSPQAPGVAQSSFSQGAGFGRRDDAAAGVPMSGGLGVLRDRRGIDSYTTGVFGQGTGYWFGTGMLLEGAGADHYDGWWYVHGSAAHYAVALLADDDGNDFYRCAEPGDTHRNTSVGVGHDFSIGWLVDRAGDDVYHAPNLSLGSGNAGGYGFFVDLAGNDQYVAQSAFSYGNASIEGPGDMLRRMTGTIGMFVDRGGTDTYMRPDISPVASDTMWLQTLHTGEGESGVGVDVASGNVGLGLD